GALEGAICGTGGSRWSPKRRCCNSTMRITNCSPGRSCPIMSMCWRTCGGPHCQGWSRAGNRLSPERPTGYWEGADGSGNRSIGTRSCGTRSRRGRRFATLKPIRSRRGCAALRKGGFMAARGFAIRRPGSSHLRMERRAPALRDGVFARAELELCAPGEGIGTAQSWSSALRPLFRLGAEQVVRSSATVFKDLVWSGRADQHAVVREVELEGCSPGIDDLALVVFVGAGRRQDNDLARGALGLAGQGFGDFGRGTGGILFEELFVLLESLDQFVGANVELGDLGINSDLAIAFHQPESASEQ